MPSALNGGCAQEWVVCTRVATLRLCGSNELHSEDRGVRMDILVPWTRQAEKVVSLCLLKSPGTLWSIESFPCSSDLSVLSSPNQEAVTSALTRKQS